ncbi:bifunctional glutamate N-acetyltransferase/amino-acid acetyltransferase ArgJ [Lysinibacillus sphaericus]|uniref:Arginine biosynthesis bifunctional protein ArgJ n=2 Tax=Lysinibacillus TaxID=400634 RepID=A0A2S0JZB2_LYSSH|nr:MULTISPECIES: bifunctional glutamate N-acetyltransferase/amino-acid acetyltransferase ArgJ [Lysinibacillus]AVK96457.1 bifunctional ornithine acetyltransferase/N-acetylglutamate synthase [Lysinibacillus sphaericus]MED4543015.1 bifunctional glutamate N-acetyltransferase/amino-acid acetyltransferase ArgJ [Lysinibacillus sphaericus]TKI19700.1 bifunctional glutamate N-acetyltransferase/amino-acid acetyltransferase ArgJ [Lysinibacillus sphaericus]TKI50341.1 bifunctional glutamate N-acetyltransfera
MQELGKKENDLQTMMPKGFYTCVKNLGIKDETLDFTVIMSSTVANAAAMFTQSKFCGAPIPIGKENVANGKLQCFVINSKNANVATGEEGIRNVQEIVNLVAQELAIAPENILPSSTGVIGHQLPMDKIKNGIINLKEQLVEGGLEKSAQAIMTTDTYPKCKICKVGNATLVGIAKGSGMIEPNMATMLSYFVTDAEIPAATLQTIFKEAVNHSFNMVSVDTDTSTSDTVAIMANGLAGKVDIKQFTEALNNMSIDLAKEIARDGEGATKLVEVTVNASSSFAQAKKVAKSIVNSPLVKTAIFGKDANWGRIAMAIGKCEDEVDLNPENISIYFGETLIYQGKPIDTVDLSVIQEYLENSEIQIKVSLGLGKEEATVWGCDLSYDYVKINGSYTT